MDDWGTLDHRSTRRSRSESKDAHHRSTDSRAADRGEGHVASMVLGSEKGPWLTATGTQQRPLETLRGPRCWIVGQPSQTPLDPALALNQFVAGHAAGDMRPRPLGVSLRELTVEQGTGAATEVAANLPLTHAFAQPNIAGPE